MYLSEVDFNNYLTKSVAFILGLQKLLPLFQKSFNSLYVIRQEKLSVSSVIKLLKEARKYKNNSRDKLVNIFKPKTNIKFDNISFLQENRGLENINSYKERRSIGIVGKQAQKINLYRYIIRFNKTQFWQHIYRWEENG